MIFISLPYSHNYKETVRHRVKIASIYSGTLLQRNEIAVAPVVFGDKILEYIALPSDFQFWGNLSISYLSMCKEVHILLLSGWKESTGVQAEIAKAKELGLPIKYIDVFEEDGFGCRFIEDRELAKKDRFVERIKEFTNKLIE